MKKLMVVLVVTLLVLSSMCFAATSFSDLNKDHWAYMPISEMTEKGILNGYPDGSFKPQGTITRAEFAKVLVLSLDLKDKNADVQFADLKKTDWSYSFVSRASDYLAGYVKDGEVYYMPSQPAVREDMTVAIVSAAGLKDAPYDLKTLNRFKDKNQISDNLYFSTIKTNKLLLILYLFCIV